VKTLSAEGRLSGWILALTPLTLFAILWALHPEYVALLTKHPQGPKLITAAVVMGTIGIVWIRKLVRIEV
jgi:tight adherence protein B